MKKIRFMLPMLAFVFAMVGAVAGDFLPGIQAYYKVSGNCSKNTALTDQTNCATSSNVALPICTVNISGHPQAYEDDACQDFLRQIP